MSENANPILAKLEHLSKLIKVNIESKNNYVKYYDNVISVFEQDYFNNLQTYIFESKILKRINWQVRLKENHISLYEADGKEDIVQELLDLLNVGEGDRRDYIHLDNFAYFDNDDGNTYVNYSNPITLYVNNVGPWISFADNRLLTKFITKYELNVDVSEIELKISNLNASIATLINLKSKVPVL